MKTNFQLSAFFNRRFRCEPKTWIRACGLTLKWQQRMINPLFHISGDAFVPLLNALQTRYETRGIQDAVGHVKQLRHAFLVALIRGQRIAGIKYSHGYPKVQGKKLINLLQEDSYRRFIVIRLTLTVLYSSRALSIGRIPNFEPISRVEKSTYVTDPKSVQSFWRAQGYWSSKTSVPKSVRFSSYHFTTKSGPNGHAQWTALDDLSILDSALETAIQTIGGSKLIENMSQQKTNLELLRPAFASRSNRVLTLRRMTWFPDKEDKVRVIAVQDFWSQTALAPLHKFLFRILKKIPQDCTFNQGKLLEQLSNSDSVKYSCDLTAATDRFPIRVICAVLEGRFPKAFVDAWKYIMVALPFERTGLSPIKYECGNPMGAYTSWASFTQAHHFIVFESCVEAKIAWAKCPYAILGDDIVIAHAEVAEIYQRKMSELGVEISQAKSHISQDMMEFAKRLFLTGTEISPFPLSALRETANRSYLLADLFDEQLRRGWTLTSIEYSLTKFYEIVFAAKAQFRAEAGSTGQVVSSLRSAIKGEMSGPDFLTDFCVRRSLPMPFGFSQDDFERFLSWGALEAFADSNESQKDGGPLGELAIALVMYITGDPRFVKPDDLVSMVPVLYSHGQISEMYMELNNRARDLSREGADWPRLMKTLMLPLSDRIYSERSSHTILRATFQTASKFEKLIGDFNYLKALESSR